MQQPLGLFIGNDSVLPSTTLLNIVILYKQELEGAIGANISNVKALFIPTTASPTPTQKPVDPSSSDTWKWIAIGVSVGVVAIILFISIVVWR